LTKARPMFAIFCLLIIKFFRLPRGLSVNSAPVW
jgi:hypothetical protein